MILQQLDIHVKFMLKNEFQTISHTMYRKLVDQNAIPKAKNLLEKNMAESPCDLELGKISCI